MFAIMLIIAGCVLAPFGAVMMAGWMGGKSRWFRFGQYDLDCPDAENFRCTDSRSAMMYLTFIAVVIAPLLGGGILIVLGLRELA
ncbi:MAG: hypothetical protein HZA50_03025 [Planctomycetes bacterium]|nr:hypothetical protein [Planctomycetota bacterium]